MMDVRRKLGEEELKFNSLIRALTDAIQRTRALFEQGRFLVLGKRLREAKRKEILERKLAKRLLLARQQKQAWNLAFNL